MNDKQQNVLGALSLFTSFGTLICCALPALLVTLGAGAALAGLVTAVPQLIWLSAHKALVFGIAGGMILISGVVRYKNRNAPCPVDPDAARNCMKLRRISALIFYFAVGTYGIGFFFAFIAKYFV